MDTIEGPNKKTAIYKQEIIEEEIKLWSTMEDVDVRDTVQILLCHVERGQKNHGKNQSPQSICMVPSVLRDVRPSSFNPRVVSIGPLHREDKNVQEFEVQKETYLHDLLNRIGSPPELTLKACVQKVNASIDTIRACHAELKTYTDIQLATMMVLDCCFIIEFLEMLPSWKTQGFICSNIVTDLILLENQIPFFVLEDIFDCTILKSVPSASLTRMLFNLLNYVDPFDAKLNTDNVGTTHDHILGLLHKCFGPSSFSKPSADYSQLPRVKSVVELNRAGVKFKPNQDNWLTAMKYESCLFMSFYWPWGRPTIKMPILHIEDQTELILRNFIAYEQFSGQVHYYFTSYAAAMDILIDGQEDITKLVESEVIVNDLGSNKEAVEMINSLGKEVCVEQFFYGEEWIELDKYYKAYWPKNIAWLRRTYFNSPWNAIALFAGIVWFALTVLQTIFTMKSEKS